MFARHYWKGDAEEVRTLCFKRRFMMRVVFLHNINNIGTRKAEVLNSLIMNITAKANDTNDILQTFR